MSSLRSRQIPSSNARAPNPNARVGEFNPAMTILSNAGRQATTPSSLQVQPTSHSNHLSPQTASRTTRKFTAASGSYGGYAGTNSYSQDPTLERRDGFNLRIVAPRDNLSLHDMELPTSLPPRGMQGKVPSLSQAAGGSQSQARSSDARGSGSGRGREPSGSASRHTSSSSRGP